MLIESVQKKFTRSICVRCNIPFDSYTDRLSKLNLKSLEYCRLVNDLILMYKICHNLTNLTFSDFFVFRTSPYNLRQHKWALQSIVTSSSQLLQSKHFFANRIPPIWNKLPECVVSAPSIVIFKKRLSVINLHSFTTFVY